MFWVCGKSGFAGTWNFQKESFMDIVCSFTVAESIGSFGIDRAIPF